ncbi:MAG: hypothetical protein ACOCRK_01985 [bacterium]
MDVSLSLKIMFDLLRFQENNDIILEDYDVVILNLNSVFSTTFYENMVNEFLTDEKKMTEYVSSISEMFKLVLTSLRNKRVILVYSNDVSNFTDIYPKWRHNRYDNKKKNEFAKIIFEHFIDIFNQLKEASPLIEIIDTKEFDPAVFTHAFILLRDFKKEILLISRDRLDFLNLINENVTMFDGQETYTKDNFCDNTVKKLPNLDIEFLKYYYTLRGIKKYDYPGVRGMGEKRTIKYIESNLNRIVDGKDEKIQPYIKIFDFDLFIDNLKDDEYQKLLEIVNNGKF